MHHTDLTSEPATTGVAPAPPLGASPQLFADVPMLIAGYRADPDAIAAALPGGLRAHEAGRVLLNMWAQPDPQLNSGFGGFGPVSVTYLAIEVAGHDGRSADGQLSAPGRFWVHHWIDNDAVRSYARSVTGIVSQPGSTTLEHDGDEVTTTLRLNGQAAIRMRARVGDQVLRTTSGHSNYFISRPRGPREELVQLSIPYVARSFDAQIQGLELAFPEGHPARRLAPLEPLEVDMLLWRRITFVPYLPYRVIRD